MSVESLEQLERYNKKNCNQYNQRIQHRIIKISNTNHSEMPLKRFLFVISVSEDIIGISTTEASRNDIKYEFSK